MRFAIVILLILPLALAIKERWAIRLPKGSNVSAYAAEHGVKHVASVSGYDIFESNGSPTAKFLQQDGLERQTRRKQTKRSDDPLYPQQWHLGKIGSGEAAPNPSGQGIVIGIVDDGLQWNHPDIRPNYVPSLSHNYNSGRPNDPAPTGDDAHGTAAAGVCCAAANNQVCGRGVAPKAKIAGIRLIAEGVYDYEEGLGLSHQKDKIRIYSSSWGPVDDGDNLAGPGSVVQATLKANFPTNVYIWAAGNGRDNADNVNYDGYANSPYVMAIGAIDYNDNQAWYSESGACLFAMAPSSGATGKGISTVDLMGAAGYEPGMCTTSFGGTSSAAPLAAGIVSLLLERRPELTPRDVQHIVAKGCVKTSPNDADWSVANARGFRHSHHWGFGIMNIPSLLNATTAHQLVPKEIRHVMSDLTRVDKTIPDDGSWLTVPIVVRDSLSFVEHVLITVQMSHSKRGQVNIEMHGSQLALHRGDSHSGSSTWTYSSLRHFGEAHEAGATWSVKFRDDTADSYKGTVQSIKITLMGFN
jgi:subtilisin family serine protease